MSAEPVSPELALVSAELREQAISAPAEMGWEAAVARVQARARAGRDANETSVADALEEAGWVFVHLMQLVVTVALATVAVTLALTLIADATR